MGDVVDLKSGNKKKITERMRKFCEFLVYGIDDNGNPLSHSEAYRKAYNSKGNSRTVSKESMRLLKNPLLTPLLSELRARKDANTQASALSERDYVLQNIKKIIENVEENASARMRGLELLGKHHSLWTDTVELKQTNTDELKQQLATRLDDLLGKSA